MLKDKSAVVETDLDAFTDQDDLQPSIVEAAREALEEANNNAVAATELLVERILRDGLLYRRLMDPLVRSACYTAVSNQIRRSRQTVWKTRQPTSAEAKNRVRALATGTANSLLNFPLPGGMLLGDAQRTDVVEAFQLYSRQAADMTDKACWLDAIARKLPEGRTVREVFSDADLDALRRKAA